MSMDFKTRFCTFCSTLVVATAFMVYSAGVNFRNEEVQTWTCFYFKLDF